eukprot:846927-Prorocentrum_lima.AAC.1
MICHKRPDGAAQGERYLFKNYNHKKGKPKDVGYWWTSSTWFNVKYVIAKYCTTSLETILDSTLKQALMADHSEAFAMWDRGASHFLLPLDNLPK